MTRCTTGIHTRTYRTLIVATTGGCLLIGFLLAAGCTQNQQAAVASQVLGTPASQLAATTVISTVAGQNPKPKTSSGIKFDGKSLRVGRKLEFDAKTESFVNDKEANALLTRNYRKPFTVPDKV